MADLTTNLKVFLARELQRQFSSLDNSVALFISRTKKDPLEDVSATAPKTGSIQKELDTRRQLQTAKILKDSTVALMIPRYNWTNKTIYPKYSYTEDNSTRQFFVYTTEGNVYACISNGGGRQSIEEPTGTGTSLIYLSNGYIWKFMYKVPVDLIDFVDENYIPIKELPIYENKPFAYGSDDKQLQYAVQYAAGGGNISAIDITSIGNEYPYTVKSTAYHKPREVTSTTVKLDAQASGTDNAYVDYSIRFITGEAAGQFSKISSYNGGTKVATVETPFSPNPSSEDVYEITPTVEITGDGSGARAYTKMHSYAANTVENIVIASAGTNYTKAEATILPRGYNTVLVANVDATGEIGRDPIFDLMVQRISILVKIEGRENQRAVLGNDYGQYGLWLSPKISTGYSGGGEIAGTEAFIRTKVDLQTTVGQTFDDLWAKSDEYIFGSESYNSGKVSNITNPFVKFSPTRGQLTVDGLNSKLKNGETVYTFTKDTSLGGFTFSGKTARVTNTLLEDSVRSSFTETYRCSHKLGISRTDGLSFDPGTPYTSIPFDASVTGGSGSEAIVLDFTNIAGGSGDLFLTNVISGSSSDTVGFIAGETLAVNDLELNITSVSPPELNLFSGKMLYIQSIEQVKRNAEQLDLFKINFDF